MTFLPRKKVVAAIDFSDTAVAALQTACELAGSPANVSAIHVILPLSYMSPPVVWNPETDREQQESTDRFMAEFLRKHNLEIAHGIVRVGDPGHEVVEFAKEQQADLIVIPSHGYHGVKRMLFGSLAEYLIRHTTCPVLVLHRHDS